MTSQFTSFGDSHWFSLFSPRCIFFQSFTFGNSPIVASYFIKEVIVDQLILRDWLIDWLTIDRLPDQETLTDRLIDRLTMRSMRKVLGHLLIRSLICLQQLTHSLAPHWLLRTFTPKLTRSRAHSREVYVYKSNVLNSCSFNPLCAGTAKQTATIKTAITRHPGKSCEPISVFRALNVAFHFLSEPIVLL